MPLLLVLAAVWGATFALSRAHMMHQAYTDFQEARALRSLSLARARPPPPSLARARAPRSFCAANLTVGPDAGPRERELATGSVQR